MAKINRWGRWDCSYCSTKKISAKHKNCPECNDPRNPEVSPSEKPYFDPNGEIIIDSKEVEWAEAGPAWNCGNCGELNQGDKTVCGFCEEPLDHDDTVRATAEYREGPDTVGIEFDDEAHSTFGYDDDVVIAERILSNEPERGEHRVLPMSDLAKRDKVSPEVDYQKPSRKPSMWAKYGTAQNKRTLKKGGMVSGGVAGLAMLGVALFGSTPVTVEVTDLQWEREVEVEEFKTLTETGWDYPSDARVISSSRQIRSYEQVPDGFETETYTERVQTGTNTRTETEYCSRTVDNGNGSFSSETYACGTRTISEPVYSNVTKTRQVQKYRSEPVYDTEYVYEIDRWVTDYWETTEDDLSDGRLDTPEWANPLVNNNHRVGDGRRETYIVVFDDLDVERDDIYHVPMDQTTWGSYDIGERYTANANNLGGLSELVPVAS